MGTALRGKCSSASADECSARDADGRPWAAILWRLLRPELTPDERGERHREPQRRDEVQLADEPAHHAQALRNALIRRVRPVEAARLGGRESQPTDQNDETTPCAAHDAQRGRCWFPRGQEPISCVARVREKRKVQSPVLWSSAFVIERPHGLAAARDFSKGRRLCPATPLVLGVFSTLLHVNPRSSARGWPRGGGRRRNCGSLRVLPVLPVVLVPDRCS